MIATIKRVATNTYHLDLNFNRRVLLMPEEIPEHIKLQIDEEIKGCLLFDTEILKVEEDNVEEK